MYLHTDMWRSPARSAQLALLICWFVFTARCVGSANTASAQGPIPLSYRTGSREFEGQFFSPRAKQNNKAILLTPDYMGIQRYPLEEAQRLAQQGYSVLVVDFYGRGLKPKTFDEADAMMRSLVADRAAIRSRMQAAMQALSTRIRPHSQIFAVGYSVGGLAALELARSGASLAGVAVISGVLDADDPASPNSIRCPVLVLHGTKDSIVPMEALLKFVVGMDASSKQFRVVLYGGALHSFTNDTLPADPALPFGFDDRASVAAHQELLRFLANPAR
jgi:dienelactone hydrolase